jgi:hypothetical protein
MLIILGGSVGGYGGCLTLPMPVPSPDKSGEGTVEWLTVKSQNKSSESPTVMVRTRLWYQENKWFTGRLI